MSSNIKPTRYYKNIYEINYDLLKEENIKYILFDLDNTIVEPKTKIPSKNAITLFETLKDSGIKPIIFSNALPYRVKSFEKELGVIGYPLSCKPLSNTYKKVLKEQKINTNQIVAVGDQIYTDILGANKMNIKSILVDPITKKESILTKINRIKENKQEIVKRGNYYE